MKEIVVSNEASNQRLDKFLAKYLNDAPKSFIYKMLRKKNIKLNGQKAQGSEILAVSDCIRIFMSDETLDKFCSVKGVEFFAGELNIVYEDKHVLIINKPRGLLTHPSASSDRDTLLSRVLSHLHKNGEYDISKESVFTPGLCNRLDRNTTGIVVCGKTLTALQQLNKAIAERKSEKYYTAAVVGEIISKGVLEGYHSKDQKRNISSIKNSGDKLAITEYEPISVKNGYSLLKIKLVTGRSHQIRTHLAGIGHSILGDGKYGGAVKGAPRFQMLHAVSIRFFGLEGELDGLNGVVFTAEPAEDFLFYQEKLFGGV